MAGLTKHPRSPYWTAIFYDGAGQKIRRSTKKSNRKEAQRVADRFEDLEKAGRSKRLVESQARKVVSEILERHTGEQLHFHSTQDWFAEWLAGKQGSVEKRTYDRYAQVCREFLAHIGDKAKQTIAAITVKDVRSFRDKLAASGLSTVTANQNARKMLAGPFVAAQRLGYIHASPCAAVEPLQETKGHREPFTAKQVADLLAVADDEWQGMILAGFYTALRMRDIADLERSQIHGDVLKLTPRKTKRMGKTVTIALHPDFLAWLNKKKRTGKLFPSLAGRATGGQWALSGQFGKLMEKAKVKGQTVRTRKGKGRQTSSLTFHSLRHTMISSLANAGVSAEIRKKLSGHSDDASHAVYTHHELETMREAIKKLPSLN